MQFPIKKRGGKKLLEERKKRVLQAIVEEYIKTAEPVSSGAIMNLEGLEYSSACSWCIMHVIFWSMFNVINDC